jgi:hypothetical protein
MRPGASEGEIEGGAKFWRRELYVEEQERMREGGRRRKNHEGVRKELKDTSWAGALLHMKGGDLISALHSTIIRLCPHVEKGRQS